MTYDFDLSPSKDRIPFENDAAEAILQTAMSYWQTLRRDGSVPLRHDLMPAKLDGTLPNAFVAQRVAPGVAKLRVAGQALREILKMDPRGMPLSVFLSPDTREALMPLVEAAFLRPALMEIALHSERSFGRPMTKARLLLLPLKDEHNETTRLLGILVTDGTSSLMRQQFSVSQDPLIQFEEIRAPQMNVRLVAQANERREPRSEAAMSDIRQSLRLVVNNS